MLFSYNRNTRGNLQTPLYHLVKAAVGKFPPKCLTSHLANLAESIAGHLLKLSHPVSHSLHRACRRHTEQYDARELI